MISSLPHFYLLPLDIYLSSATINMLFYINQIIQISYGLPRFEYLELITLLLLLLCRLLDFYFSIRSTFTVCCCVEIRFICIQDSSFWFILKISRFFLSSYSNLHARRAGFDPTILLYRSGLINLTLLLFRNTFSVPLF